MMMQVRIAYSDQRKCLSLSYNYIIDDLKCTNTLTFIYFIFNKHLVDSDILYYREIQTLSMNHVP